MKVLLLGATGRLGRCVLRDLVDSGHTIHLLARYKERLPFEHPNVKVYIGNVSDEGHLREALQGCEAVLNVLNISRNSDFPWAKLRTPVTLLSTTMKALIKVMNSCQVKRVVVTTAWGVGDSWREVPRWFRWLIEHSNIRYAYQDHQRQEKLLQSSGLDWTIVRPTGLTNSPKIRKLVISRHGKPRPYLIISRSHVSRMIVNTLEAREYVGEMVTISEK